MANVSRTQRKKTYAYSKVVLQPWKVEFNGNVLENPTILFLKRFELNKIQHCTYQTYCYHGNTIRRILVEGQPSLDVFLEESPATIIEKMQKGLESDISSYYRKLMDFINIYLATSLELTSDENNKKG